MITQWTDKLRLTTAERAEFIRAWDWVDGLGLGPEAERRFIRRQVVQLALRYPQDTRHISALEAMAIAWPVPGSGARLPNADVPGAIAEAVRDIPAGTCLSNDEGWQATRTAVSTAITRYQRAVTQWERVLSLDDTNDDTVCRYERCPDARAADAMALIELMDALRRALSALEFAVVNALADGYKQAEIGQALGKSQGWVSQLIDGIRRHWPSD